MKSLCFWTFWCICKNTLCCIGNEKGRQYHYKPLSWNIGSRCPPIWVASDQGSQSDHARMPSVACVLKYKWNLQVVSLIGVNMWGKICGWWVEILIGLLGYEYDKRGEKNKERCYGHLLSGGSTCPSQSCHNLPECALSWRFLNWV